MLIRFAVENFLSFKENTIFSMVAGKFTRHSSHIINTHGKRFLKGGFIFGANAGGKTNFVRAINFAKNIVVDGLPSVSCDKKFFRIDDAYKDKPGIFQFDIYSSNHFYSYGFAVSYKDISIEEEWLYQTDENGEKCIFLRSRDKNNQVSISSQLQFSEEMEENRFKVYSESIKDVKMKQTLFLSDIVLHSPENDEQYRAFRDVKNWFNKLTIIFPESKFQGYPSLLKDINAKKELENLLAYFDTGILGISNRDEDFDKVFRNMPIKTLEDFKADIINDFSKNTEKPMTVFVSNGESLIQIKYIDGKLFASKIFSNHGNEKDLFELEDESDGTKRLFDLIPLFLHIQENGVIIIDELDRSLHTMVTKEFIDYFYKNDVKNSAQLIATTHDSNIMNLDFLRQDEIWFIDRDNNHSSQMYSLNKFKARFDKKIEKEYLLGRYGAIPIFSQTNSDLIDDDTQTGDDYDGK
jgi:AAA15 family ATPase/GTPase